MSDSSIIADVGDFLLLRNNSQSAEFPVIFFIKSMIIYDDFFQYMKYFHIYGYGLSMNLLHKNRI